MSVPYDYSRLFYFIPLLLLLSKLLYAQEASKIAQQEKLLGEAKGDSEKVEVLNDLCFNYVNTNLEKSIAYGEQALQLSQKIKFPKGEADSYNNLGWAYYRKGDYRKGEELLLISLEKFKAIGNQKFISVPNSNLGWLHMSQSHFPEALKYFFDAMKASEASGDKAGEAVTLYSIGAVYNKQQNSPEARRYFLKALEMEKVLNRPLKQAACLGGIGNSYLNENNFEKAIEYQKMALTLYTENNDKYEIGIANENIGDSYRAQQKYDAALQYYRNAKAQYVSLGSKEDISYIDQLIGNTLLESGKTAEALKIFGEGLGIAKEMNAIDDQQQYYENISNAYANLGDFKNAYDNYKLSISLRDSILNRDKQDELLRLQTQFETSEKEKEIALLNKDKQLKEAEAAQQRQLKNIFIGGAVLLLLLALILVNRYQLKQRTAKELSDKNKIIEKEKRRAEASEQFKSQFLANMSHEIRTPMNAVMGMTNLLLDEPQTQKNDRYLNVIKNASENLLVIINDVLDLSKIEAGKMTLEHIPFHPNEVVNSVYETLQLKAEEKGLKLIVDISGNIPPVVVGDPNRLMQVLLNLAGNAVKFTEKGSVVIKLESKEGADSNQSITHLQFSIIDTGIGIEKVMLEKIFESFTQAHAEDSRKYGGTGLGLTISQNLVALLGGKLEVDSEPGAGSVFSFVVPVKIGTEEQLEERQMHREGFSSDDLFGLKILLAEDNEHNQLVAVDTLKKIIEEVEIKVVKNGKEVLESLNSPFTTDHSPPYDLILMDIQMPEMDGYETTRKIRDEFPLGIKDIPIIALTASVVRSDLKKCIDAGMNGYVVKPFRKEDLVREIGKVLHVSTMHDARNMMHDARTTMHDGSGGDDETRNQELETRNQKPATVRVNFSELNKVCGNDTVRMKEYLLQFLELVPSRLSGLQAAYEESNRENIYQMAHKLKPQLGFFGMKKEELIANTIEIKARELSHHELYSLLDQLKDGCNLAMVEIREALIQMS